MRFVIFLKSTQSLLSFAPKQKLTRGDIPSQSPMAIILKINIEYPILEKTNKESLKLSITKFWGEKINQKGNVVLAGHNNLNNKMFGKIDRLENGDIIELTDSQMVTVKYQVFDKYVIDPNDIDCIFPIDENTREITLITCTNRDKNRLVVKAREII